MGLLWAGKTNLKLQPCSWVGNFNKNFHKRSVLLMYSYSSRQCAHKYDHSKLKAWKKFARHPDFRNLTMDADTGFWKICLRTFKFDRSQFCSPLSYKNSKYFLWTSSSRLMSICKFQIQERSGTFGVFYSYSKYPYFSYTYLHEYLSIFPWLYVVPIDIFHSEKLKEIYQLFLFIKF